MKRSMAVHCDRLVCRLGWFLFALVAIAMMPFNSSGQITGPLDRQTPLALTPGAPSGSRIEDLASVNLFNGNLNFALPLATAGGRGEIETPLMLTIERHWQVHTRCDLSVTGQLSCNKFVSSMWWGNQQVGYGPGIVQGRGADTYTYQSNGGSPLCSPNGGVVFTFTDPSGTEHELRDLLTGGQPHTGGSCGFLRGTNFTSVDGTSMTFVSDSVINDDWSNGPDPAQPAGYLLFANGTRYRVENGLVVWIRDRNGNKVSYVYETYTGNASRVKTITDALGRTITVNYDVNDPTYGLCDQIVLPGFGMTSRIVSVTKTSLSAALRYDQAQTQTYGQLFPESSWLNAGTQFNPSIVSGVYLPNGQSYKFYYNTYGELARIQIPTGGAVDYDYLGGLTNGPNSGVIIDSRYVYRRVVAKRVFTSASDLASNTKVTTYSRPESWSPGTGKANSVGFVSIDDRAADSSFLAYEKHYLYGSAANSFITPNPYPAWKDGKEYRTELFDIDRTTVLRSSTNNWQQRASVWWWSNYAAGCCNLNPNDEPANDPRVVETTEVIEPSGANLVSKASAINPQTLAVGFDQHNNQTDAWEYGYGVGAPSTYPMRHAHTDYLAVNPANNISYADPVTGNSYTANDVHLRGVPRARQIYSINPTNGIETLVGQSETRYDEPAYSPLTYGTVTSWIDPGAARGNATTIRNWINTSGSWLQTHAQYDQCGSVRNIWDVKGNQSQIEYSSTYAYAYPTLTRTPVPDPSGQHGSAIAFEATTVFDFNTGLVTFSTDTNNVTAKFEYNDALNRPTRTVRAYGSSVQSQSSIAYDDLNRIITTTSDQNTYNDNVLKSQVVYDGLGRAIESRQYESGTNYIAVQTQYDALGRAFKTSNPLRPWQNETAVWTTTAFDALGRAISITTPDGAVASTSYSGDRVLVTDQAGKQRISKTNALGQLKDIWEVTAADPATEAISFPNHPEVTAGYRTSYSYDTLDNLVTVNQGTQTRTFTYDSLNRLTSAANPESGPINYQYDANGNLTQKIDARTITTTYAYDALNRVTTRDYSDSTPDVSYVYDSAGVSHSKGRLTSVSSSVSSYSYSGYDAIGRVTGATQSIGSQSYPITNLTYDLAGHLKTMTYPSGRTVTNTYDDAGRLASFAGNLGGSQRTYASGISYSPFGGMKWEQYGTDTPLYHKTFYNIRGQMFDTRVSSVNDTWDWNRGRLILYYSSNHQWGASGTDNNGNVRFAEHWIPPPNATLDQAQYLIEDSYDYDSLNRLSSVAERTLDIGGGGSWTPRFAQAYTYDRYGNRTINAGTTWGTGINNKQFTVDTNTNRLGVPGGQSGAMSYDSAGNLTTDTYSGTAVTRVYDAENKMTSETTYNSVVSGSYSYDGDGRRVKRVVGGVETWQVYGIGGELIAEYAANADDSTPQKEYGYRNGELLITATVTTGWGAPPSYTGPNPLSNGDQIKLENLTELRSAVNQLRQHAGLAPYNFTVDPNPQQNVTQVKADHIRQLRTALEEARTALGLSIGGYEHPTLTENFSLIFAVDFQELRGQVLSAWQSGGGVDIRWLVADHLGTPRMIFDQTGSLANMSRHDYLPFGEELFAGTGGRLTGQGYTNADGARQKFTSKERDNETGLDYFLARYYSSGQGRFTSPDEFTGGPDELYDFADDAADNPTFYAELDNPQSLNKYQYTYNDPVNMIDPDGHCPPCLFGPSMAVEPDPTRAFDKGQLVISIAGILPGADGADLVNAGISALRGQYKDAALDAAGAIPVVGSAFPIANRGRKLLKLANKTDNAIDAGKTLLKNIDDAAGGLGPKPQNLEVRHASWKRAREAAEHPNPGKKMPTPPKSDKKKRRLYAEQQKYRKPERHPNSRSPRSHFHDRNKSRNRRANVHHTYPR